MCGVVAAVATLQLFADATGTPEPASWRVAPDADIGPDTATVPLLVSEGGCASGDDARGRVHVEVDYDSDAVVLDVRVEPLRGDQECPSNPETPYTLELDEPLGDRELTGPRQLAGPPE